MRDAGFNASLPGRLGRRPALVRIVLSMSLLVFLGYMVGGGVIWLKGRRSLEGNLDRMERDVSVLLQRLATAPEDAFMEPVDSALSRAKLWRERLVIFKRMDQGQADRIFNLYAVDEKFARWKSLAGETDDPEALPFARRWMTVQGEIRLERTKWPALASRSGLRLPRSIGVFADGLLEGLIWPYSMCLRLKDLYVFYSGRGEPGFIVPVRYLVFPHRLGRLAAPWVFGFGVATVLSGYAFCWCGLKWRRRTFSELGLAYLLYALIFATLLGLLLGGIIA